LRDFNAHGASHNVLERARIHKANNIGKDHIQQDHDPQGGKEDSSIFEDRRFLV
jgi:hypothetical protein